MRVYRIVCTIAAAALALAACADSPTSPGSRPPAPPAASGGSTSSGGGATGGAKVVVAGQWAGAFQSAIQYNSNVSFALAQSGSAITGTMTFTLTNVAGQKVSAVTGTFDGTNLTLHFDSPAGPGSITARPSAHTRYGTGFVALVISDDGSGRTLGTLNVGRQ